MKRGIKSAVQRSIEDPLNVGLGEKAVDFVTRYHKIGNGGTLILPNQPILDQWQEEDYCLQSVNSPNIKGLEWHDRPTVTRTLLWELDKGTRKASLELLGRLLAGLEEGQILAEGITVSGAIAILSRVIKRGDFNA